MLITKCDPHFSGYTKHILDLYRNNSPVKYQYARCSTGKRMVSYDDVVNLEKQLLKSSKLTPAVWINATGTYTPWVIFKGLYRIAAEHIVNTTRVNDTTQFVDCVKFCSLENWPYIGLQVIILPGLQYDNFYDGLGECLKAKFESYMYLSSSPSPCNDKNLTTVLCINKTGSVQGLRVNNENERLESCEGLHLTCVDFKTLNFTLNIRTHNTEYWLNNFRESTFSKGGQHLQSRCVVGKAVNDKITLHITACAKEHYVLCIRDEVMYDNIAQNTTTTMTSHFDVTATVENRNIKGYEMHMVPSIIGANVIVLVIFFICWTKYHKHTYISTSVASLQSPQTPPSSSQVQRTPFRDKNTRREHDYTEVDIEMTTMGRIVFGVDGYLVPDDHTGNFSKDPSITGRSNMYVNDLPMSSAEPFNLYQQLKEQRQCDTHLYTSITDDSLNKHM